MSPGHKEKILEAIINSIETFENAAITSSGERLLKDM
jgi:hypothetical protein